MPYTLSMALLWVALAVLLGIVVGWLMRSVVAKRQVERARANHLDTVELERLRARVVELESAPAPGGSLRDGVELVTVAEVAAPDVAPDAAPDATSDTTAETTSDVTAPVVASAGDTPAGTSDDRVTPSGGNGPDTTAASALGRDVEPDDLTVVDGIGPKVAALCDGIGIQTWRDLAQTEVSLLRTMLHDAGPRFRSHDPSSWPEQAALLAEGRWAEFRTFNEHRKDGHPVD